MKIAHVSPLPPARSGIADYAARIAEALSGRHELVAIEKPGETAVPPDAVPLVQLGNHGIHAAAYDLALNGGAVVALHDATLHHMILGKFAEADYLAEFVRQYGLENRELGAELWAARGGAMHDERYFRYGMTGAVAKSARAVIVHNPEAADRARQAGAETIVEAPHFVDPAPVALSDADRRAVRASMGFGDEDVVFAVFGYLRPAKRIASIAQALGGMAGPWKLLICGESASPQAETVLQLPPERVVRRPFLEEDDWWRVAAAVDVCVNLRYPSAAETSGIALRMMSLGVPLIVTQGREWARFPEGALLAVDAGETEVALLRELMELAAVNRRLRRSVGAIAREYVLREHAMDRVVAAYERALHA